MQEKKGYVSFVLHAHLPFIHHPESNDYLEESWLYEAISETYIPLLTYFKKLVDEGVNFRITMSMTPPLLSMLDNELLQQKYIHYLEQLIELSEKEIKRTSYDERLNRLSHYYYERYSNDLHLFKDVFKCNLIEQFKHFQDIGVLEIITCGATHGYFPILYVNEKTVRAQIAVGVQTYEKYFGKGSTNCMTESAAPIQYFFRRYASATNLVNVDIGGGTTDIAFAKNKEIQFVTSFKFASNALFEDPFSDLNKNNGIIDWSKDSILQLIKDKGLNELERIFKSPNNANPANLASFLFSLKDNSMIRGIDSKLIDFNYMLQEDEEFKIVFILFYTSIIYHIANIVKVKKLSLPRHITFSGNGSKVIKVVSMLLAKYTKLIFEEVTGEKYVGELDILGLDKNANPKEVTCKGGIIGFKENNERDKIIVFKGCGSGFVDESDTYDQVDDDYIRNTVEAVRKFFDFALNTMNGVFNFDENFGVTLSSLNIAKDVCYKDISTFLEKGIAQRREEAEGQDRIEETFFFYPIKGVLNVLSQAIYESLQNNIEK